MKARREKARRTLQFCLAVTTASIAQQGLLGGDVLLPRLSETIAKEPTLKLLKSNRVMARNTLMFEINRRLRNNQQTILAYEFALQSIDRDYLLELLKLEGEPKWTFEKLTKDPGTGRAMDEAKWFVTIGDLVMPMPAADDLRTKKLELMPTVATLATLREDLITRIAELDFVETIPAVRALRLGLLSM